MGVTEKHVQVLELVIVRLTFFWSGETSAGKRSWKQEEADRRFSMLQQVCVKWGTQTAGWLQALSGVMHAQNGLKWDCMEIDFMNSRHPRNRHTHTPRPRTDKANGTHNDDDTLFLLLQVIGNGRPTTMPTTGNNQKTLPPPKKKTANRCSSDAGAGAPKPRRV